VWRDPAGNQAAGGHGCGSHVRRHLGTPQAAAANVVGQDMHGTHVLDDRPFGGGNEGKGETQDTAE